MRKVLVTGAAGFIGKNLVVTLEDKGDFEVLKFDRDDTKETLEKYLSEAEFIFHLAGVNRPKKEAEFEKGNHGLTKQIIEYLETNRLNTPILITSSIQAELDNPYGKSKLAAENDILAWSKRTDTKAYVYRLPNVFGKWCRPNYNSVVATFCHNVANGIEITINDPGSEINLVYIDDVVADFIAAVSGKKQVSADGYCHIARVTKTTLGALANNITSFGDSRNSLKLQSFESAFSRFLYATYTSYLPIDKFGYELEMKNDDRGWLAEFIKSDQFGQIFVSKTKLGITRGNHWHHTKIEKFLVLEGDAEISFRDITTAEVLRYKVSGNKLKVVDIPAGYTHSIKNIGNNDLVTLFWSDEIFNQENPDTYYKEV